MIASKCKGLGQGHRCLVPRVVYLFNILPAISRHLLSLLSEITQNNASQTDSVKKNRIRLFVINPFAVDGS